MYNNTHVNLTPYQKQNMIRSIKKGLAPILKLGRSQLTGGKDVLPLTKMQLKRLSKAKKTGSGLKIKMSKSQVKKGGIFPLLFPILGALGALSGGAAGIAKAVQDKKAKDKELEEVKRHNATMESLAIRQGKGLKRKKKATNRGKGFYLKQRYR